MTLEKVTAYSQNTDLNYPSWDDLVAAEAHGWTVTTLVTSVNTKTGKTQTLPHIVGLYETQAEAKRVAARTRRDNKRRIGGNPRISTKVFVRCVWFSDMNEYGEDAWHRGLEWLHRRGHELMDQLDGYAHLTASQEVKDELVYIRNELERQGFDLTKHCIRVRDGQGWRAVFFDLEGNVVRER